MVPYSALRLMEPAVFLREGSWQRRMCVLGLFSRTARFILAASGSQLQLRTSALVSAGQGI